jgi:CDP-diglyceride synthetase
MEACLKRIGEKAMMLGKRTLTALALAAVGIPAIILGGIYYYALITLFLAVAGWEYGRLFEKVDCKVPQVLLIGGIILVVTTRTFFPDLAVPMLALSILACMACHLLDYEKGRDRAASDFAVTTAGIV